MVYNRTPVKAKAQYFDAAGQYSIVESRYFWLTRYMQYMYRRTSLVSWLMVVTALLWYLIDLSI